MKPLPECRLYAFVDTAYLGSRSAAVVARQLCDGGADLIQLRAKNSRREEVLSLARELRPITRQAGVGLVVNDHFSVARECGADFCHLGQEDFFDAGHTNAAELRAGDPAVRIGLSTHAPEQAARAVRAGADYVAIGPVYATVTKPTAPPVTLDYVRWAAANITVPWFAIGGITLRNIDEVLAAGATRICVVSAILAADDVAAACRQYRRRLDGAT